MTAGSVETDAVAVFEVTPPQSSSNVRGHWHGRLEGLNEETAEALLDKEVAEITTQDGSTASIIATSLQPGGVAFQGSGPPPTT